MSHKNKNKYYKENAIIQEQDIEKVEALCIWLCASNGFTALGLLKKGRNYNLFKQNYVEKKDTFYSNQVPGIFSSHKYVVISLGSGYVTQNVGFTEGKTVEKNNKLGS